MLVVGRGCSAGDGAEVGVLAHASARSRRVIPRAPSIWSKPVPSRASGCAYLAVSFLKAVAQGSACRMGAGSLPFLALVSNVTSGGKSSSFGHSNTQR